MNGAHICQLFIIFLSVQATAVIFKFQNIIIIHLYTFHNKNKPANFSCQHIVSLEFHLDAAVYYLHFYLVLRLELLWLSNLSSAVLF